MKGTLKCLQISGIRGFTANAWAFPPRLSLLSRRALLYGGASGRLCFHQCGGYASQGQAHCIHSNKLWQRNILKGLSLAELCDLAVKRLHCAWQVSPC